MPKYHLFLFIHIFDETSINSQIIEKDNCATAPVNPTKTGYEFDGWTIDGKTIEDVSKYEITSNTTFKAVFYDFFCENVLHHQRL